MTPPAAWKWMADIGALAELAQWLERQRRGRYAELIRGRHLTEHEADMDARAREAIAAVWCAINAVQPPRSTRPAKATERDWCLREALRIAGLHHDRAIDEQRRAELADIRDAIAALLHWEATGAVDRMLDTQRKLRGRPVAPATIVDAAPPQRAAA